MDDIRHRMPEKRLRFLDQVRFQIREAGLAYRTEQAYIYRVKRYIYFHGKKHPKGLGHRDIEAFLNDMPGGWN